MFRLLGLCRRSGMCLCGASAVEAALRRKACRVVLIATDAGKSTGEKFARLCEINGVRCFFPADKQSLGKAVGFPEKAVLGITDENFAKGILKSLGE